MASSTLKMPGSGMWKSKASRSVTWTILSPARRQRIESKIASPCRAYEPFGSIGCATVEITSGVRMTRIVVLVGPCLLAALTLSLPAHEQPVPKLRVPEGFLIEQVAGEPDVLFPMFAVFDDRGRL